MAETEEKLTFEKVWQMFQETDKRMKETDKLMQETDRLIKENAIQMKETDKKFQETDKKFQETDKKFQETDKEINKLTKKVSEGEGRWGKFVESLVGGNLIELLKERGIFVQAIIPRPSGYFDGKQYEYDIVAVNGELLVAVEVKTTLKVSDVKHFLETMKEFRNVTNWWADRTIYGGVGFINVVEDADKYAERQGLFVIKATGESATIINAEDFKPRKM